MRQSCPPMLLPTTQAASIAVTRLRHSCSEPWPVRRNKCSSHGRQASTDHVLTLEAFGARALEDVLAFAGLRFLGDSAYKSLDQVTGLVTAQRNVARDGGAQKIEAAHKAELDAYFKPMNRKLDALLGWKSGYPT